MANWVENAKAQAALRNVQIKAGEGQLVSEGPWQVVVELRSPIELPLIPQHCKDMSRPWLIFSA